MEIQALAARSPPEGQSFQEKIESGRRPAARVGRPGILDHPAEGDQVGQGFVGGQAVRPALPGQPAPARPGHQVWLEQPPDRPDVLVDDVDRAARRVLAPQQLNQIIDGDQLISPHQEQPEYRALLVRAQA